MNCLKLIIDNNEKIKSVFFYNNGIKTDKLKKNITCIITTESDKYTLSDEPAEVFFEIFKDKNSGFGNLNAIISANKTMNLTNSNSEQILSYDDSQQTNLKWAKNVVET